MPKKIKKEAKNKPPHLNRSALKSAAKIGNILSRAKSANQPVRHGGKKSDKFLIIHDRDNCIGCAACVAVCEKYWKMASDGKATLIGGKKKEKNYELELQDIICNEEAASVCPMDVIHIIKE